MSKKPRKEGEPEPTPAGPAETYEFVTPNFDEEAFMRREVESSRSTFYTLVVSIPTGVLAAILDHVADRWALGWIPILAALVGLTFLLRFLGFSEEATKPRNMLGNWALLFFTALSLWILSHNLPF